MICGIGIDSVTIERFNHWKDYTPAQLQRIFTKAEIEYCTKVPALMLERLAVRFAAKEAFYKAWSSFCPSFTVPLMSICPLVEVQHSNNGAPRLEIDWNFIYKNSPAKTHNVTAHIALTHTETTATACVILEQIENNNTPSQNHTDTILQELELYMDTDDLFEDEDSDEEEDDDSEDDEFEIEKHPGNDTEIFFNKTLHSHCKKDPFLLDIKA
jgi:phosphopantetheine--protein transferase-like protein